MTSIEFIEQNFSLNISVYDWLLIIEKAKEMHKQEIIDAWEMGRFNIDAVGLGEEYYQETFVSKGSYINGDIVTKDSVIVELPQQEISNGEIEKLASKHYPEYYSIGLGVDRIGFERGYNLAKETLYTEEQVREAIRMSRITNTTNVIGGGIKLHTYSDNEIIQSLKQPKNNI